MLNNGLLPGLFSVFVFLHFFSGSTPVQAQFDYPSSPADFSFVGDAGMNGSALRLIQSPPPNGAFTAAAVWHNQTQRATDGFVTMFTFRILNPQGSNGGGDGLAFVLHSGGTSTIGFGSAQMGYADPGGIPNSLALEFDTYQNFNLADFNANHLSLHTNYTYPNNAGEWVSIAWNDSLPIYLRDGVIHAVRIEYDGPTNAHQMRVFIDNTPVLTCTVNLSTILAGGGPNARLGFTAGAAGASENNDILSWSFAPSPNVTEVTFHQIAPDTPRTVQIDANPLIDNDGRDYGLRLFPDHDLPQDNADRSTIRVDAHLGTNLPNRMVYFRTFDMDDPSVQDSQIDPDVVGNDNRGSVPGGTTAGRIRIPPGMEDVCEVRSMSVACPTASDGIASVNFTVTKQPGDNFAIAASTNEAEVNAVNFDPADGLHLLSGAGTRLNSTCGAVEDKVCRSRLLTVWRRLHIETDSMPTVQENHINVRLVPPPPGGPPGITIAAGKTRVLDVWDPVRLDLEDGRFVAGRAHVGNSWMSVQNNTEYEITVTNTTLNDIPILYSDTFQLYDDDDFNNNNGTSVIGDEGEPILMTERDEQFWTVYLLNAYQGLSDRDGDGLTPGDGFAPPMNEQVDVGFTTYNDLASFIFVEPAGTKECNSRAETPPYSCDVSVITAREVAIALGAQPNDGGLLKLESTVLSSQSLDKIRNKLYP